MSGRLRASSDVPASRSPLDVPLQALGIHATLAGRTVLMDVSLECRAGEWLALVGPNGAGKSTLLRCLSGLLKPQRGQITLGGRGLAEWSPRQRARQIAWLAQGDALDAELAPAVLDVVQLGRIPHHGLLGGQTASDRSAVQSALDDTDSAAHSHRALDALSGGERQRVLLARALAAQATVLLLDEPTSHLDAPHQRLLARVLKREAARGRAVVSVMHDLNLALAADRIAVMARGHLVAHGPCDSHAVHRAIEAVFDDAVAVQTVGGRVIALPML